MLKQDCEARAADLCSYAGLTWSSLSGFILQASPSMSELDGRDFLVILLFKAPLVVNPTLSVLGFWGLLDGSQCLPAFACWHVCKFVRLCVLARACVCHLVRPHALASLCVWERACEVRVQSSGCVCVCACVRVVLRRVCLCVWQCLSFLVCVCRSVLRVSWLSCSRGRAACRASWMCCAAMLCV